MQHPARVSKLASKVLLSHLSGQDAASVLGISTIFLHLLPEGDCDLLLLNGGAFVAGALTVLPAAVGPDGSQDC